MSALFHRGHALLIGVGGDLPCTIRDVEGLRNILVNPKRCAYPPDQVRLLTEENASVEGIRVELKRLAKVIEKEKQGSTVIVYFSGHGGYVQSSEGDAYSLVAYGYGGNQFRKTTMHGREFTALLEDIRAERLLLVLDCCHAGGIELPLAKGSAYKELSPQVRTILASKKGRAVLASSTGAELSWTGKPYSAFTHSLLEALCGEGNPRRDGFVRIGDLVTYTSQQVPRKTNDRQHPTFDFKSDNFEIAYYGGGDNRVEPLPFEKFVPEAALEQELLPAVAPEGIINQQLIVGHRGSIKKIGLTYEGPAEAIPGVVNKDILKQTEGNLDLCGAEIKIPPGGRRSTRSKRSRHGE
ncbi:MAG: caspase family protein [Acidobacteriia bacterium]|nr:caspase family protein [Terriglobia bacterium]